MHLWVLCPGAFKHLKNKMKPKRMKIENVSSWTG